MFDRPAVRLDAPHLLGIMAALAIGFLAAATISLAAPSDEILARELTKTSKELDDVKRDLQTIKQELQEIKQLLRARDRAPMPLPAPETAQTGSVEGDHFLGTPDAPLTLVEFVDYQCRLCAQFHLELLPRLTEEFINTGRLRYMVRDFPMGDLHPMATKAAEAAHCADAQGYFWPMHSLLLEHQLGLDADGLLELARGLELNLEAFSACLNDGRHASRIVRSKHAAERAGILGTPSYVLGRTSPDGLIRGRLLRGAQSYPTLKDAIDELRQP